jgi:hypothetical protein
MSASECGIVKASLIGMYHARAYLGAICSAVLFRKEKIGLDKNTEKNRCSIKSWGIKKAADDAAFLRWKSLNRSRF